MTLLSAIQSLVDITEEFFDSIEPHLHENKVVEINRTVDFRTEKEGRLTLFRRPEQISQQTGHFRVCSLVCGQ